MLPEINTVYEGDCLELMRGWPDKCVDLILTDLPYNEVNRPTNGLRVLDKGCADVGDFDIAELARELARLTKGSVYAFCGTAQIQPLRDAFAAAGMSTRVCVWRKTNPSPMNGEHIWLSGIEWAVFGKHPGAVFNERCKNCVWDFPSGSSEDHPTQKPDALFEYLIQVSSNPGELVLDPFLGSGTTGAAAERMGRNWVGCELNPEYVRLARRRTAQKGLQFAA